MKSVLSTLSSFGVKAACFALATSFSNLALSQTFNENNFALPDVSMVDEFGVNLSGANATMRVDGFSMGPLTHDLVATNGVIERAEHHHKYDGFARRLQYPSGDPSVYSPWPLGLYVVEYERQTLRFEIGTGNTHYDVRGSGAMLVTSNGMDFDLTLSDGRVVRYEDNRFVSTRYPNGLLIEVHRNDNRMAVVSSDGFMLLHLHDSYNRVVEVIGINLAVSNCDLTRLSTCTTSGDWPRQQYIYAAGDPNQNLLDLEVVHPDGTRTSIDNESYGDWQPSNVDGPCGAYLEIGGRNEGEYITCMYGRNNRTGHQSNSDIERTVSISKPGTFTQTWQYFDLTCIACGVHRPGIVKETRVGDRTYNYASTIINGGDSGEFKVTRSGGGRSLVAEYHTLSYDSRTARVESDNSVALFNTDVRNRLSSYTEAGITTHYQYDARNNVTERRTENALNQQQRIETATYPSSCSNVATCNLPSSITDANGNTTSFAYHSSGLIERVTYPADANGVAESRYYHYQEYQPYPNIAGRIWKLDRYVTCTRGTATAQGCNDSSAEVVTEYLYDTNHNLNLVGVKTITNSGTQLTCFAYDDRGRKISETSPRSNQTSCP